MKGVKNFEATTILIPTFTQASPLQKDKATKEDNSTEHRGKKKRKHLLPQELVSPLSLPLLHIHTHTCDPPGTHQTRSVLDAQGTVLPCQQVVSDPPSKKEIGSCVKDKEGREVG